MNPYAIVIAALIVAWFVAMLIWIPSDLAALAQEAAGTDAGLGQERLLTAAEAPEASALAVTAESRRPYNWADEGVA